MNLKITSKSIIATFFGASILLFIYFAAVLIFYGPAMLAAQFLTYWYFLFILALSFGVHLGRELHPLL